MTDDEKFEAHIKSTAWYGVLSQAAKDDDEGASSFRMARMAAREAWSASLAQPNEAQVDARDARRYRWLVKNCFDWGAPGDGDSFDYIELHFEHEMLNRDDESVGAAIDAEIAREARGL